VRYDPFDAGTAYAFVQGAWVECHSEYYSVLRNRSEREIKVATEELRRRRRLHSQQFNVTAKKLAEFLESVEAEEQLLAQRLRDREMQHVLSQIKGKSSSEIPPVVDNGHSGTTSDKAGPSQSNNKKAQQNGEIKLKNYGRF
jgi:hypothetical protein